MGQQVGTSSAASLEPYTLEYAERVTGLTQETLIAVANEISKAKTVCILWAMGVTQHCGGSDTSTSFSNLLLATGNYKRPGCGGYPLRGHNNVQGASDFGSHAERLLRLPEGRRRNHPRQVRSRLGLHPAHHKGLDNHEMIEAIYEGKLKALYIKGEDTITSDANANYVDGAFRMLDFMIVQDINFSETCRYADLASQPAPRSKRTAPSSTPNAASSVSIKRSIRSGSRCPTGRSSSASQIN